MAADIFYCRKELKKFGHKDVKKEKAKKNRR